MMTAQTMPRQGSRDDDKAPATTTRRPEGLREPELADRKQQVLTKGRATVVASITDAVAAKDREPFFLCQPDGQVPLHGHHGYGLYHHDCRFLRGYELTVAGGRLDTLAATEASGTTLLIELTNSAIDREDLHVDKEQLGVTWTRTVDADGPALVDQISVRNYGRDDVVVPLDLRFAASFEDVFVIRGLLDRRPGTHHDPAWHGDELEFGYEGGDGIDRFLRVSLDGPTPDRDADGASLRLKVSARGETNLRVRVALEERSREGASPIEERDAPRDASRAERRAPRPQADNHLLSDGWIGGESWVSSWRTSSFALRATLARSLDDLAQLRSSLDGLRYYEAGIPWFATLFGRDSLIAAWQTLAFDPDIAAETLRLLADRRGRREDGWRDEQPGKILHELRIGELARMGEIPHTPYYGSIDATPLFLMVLARHAAWTGSLDLFHELGDAVTDALAWLDRYADSDGDGFVDYASETRHGLVNQGWKDSGNGIVDEHGDIATPPIALCEVQGYTWRAWTDMARLHERAGDAEAAAGLREKAEALRRAFEERFWSERLGCYLLALANGQPCEVATSNPGQVLWTGIADPERARRTAERLMREDLFSGWGVRTLSTEAAAYHPIGYHLGTVWPHDNALIADGFRRYGRDDEAERIFLGILEAAQHFPGDRLPECFAGFPRDRFLVPVRYPVACHPQAWAAGTIPALLVSALGLEPDGFARSLSVRRPRLPQGIETVEVRDLPLADGRVSLRYDRTSDGRTAVQVVDAAGINVAVDADEEEAGGR
jgi:glycogen debranching enzyme